MAAARREFGSVLDLVIRRFSAGRKPTVQELNEALRRDPRLELRDDNQETALFITVKEGCIDTLRWLLEHKAVQYVYNKDNLTPLMVAVDSDKPGSDLIAQALIERTGSKDYLEHDTGEFNSAIFLATQKKKLEIVKALVSAGVKCQYPWEGKASNHECRFNFSKLEKFAQRHQYSRLPGANSPLKLFNVFCDKNVSVLLQGKRI